MGEERNAYEKFSNLLGDASEIVDEYGMTVTWGDGCIERTFGTTDPYIERIYPDGTVENIENPNYVPDKESSGEEAQEEVSEDEESGDEESEDEESEDEESEDEESEDEESEDEESEDEESEDEES
ncbi:MAG TPA: hypothetical protein PKK94_13730, partial [Leptospiraceae bacterium]|nr:hypothetical protein [Leptospiraceae bacterium]HNO24039.1 hypothetical protein [Leptospiraceae bacterium]